MTALECSRQGGGGQQGEEKEEESGCLCVWCYASTGSQGSAALCKSTCLACVADVCAHTACCLLCCCCGSRRHCVCWRARQLLDACGQCAADECGAAGQVCAAAQQHGEGQAVLVVVVVGCKYVCVHPRLCAVVDSEHEACCTRHPLASSACICCTAQWGCMVTVCVAVWTPELHTHISMTSPWLPSPLPDTQLPVLVLHAHVHTVYSRACWSSWWSSCRPSTQALRSHPSLNAATWPCTRSSTASTSSAEHQQQQQQQHCWFLLGLNKQRHMGLVAQRPLSLTHHCRRGTRHTAVKATS